MKLWQCWACVILAAFGFALSAAFLSSRFPQYDTSLWWSAGIFYGVVMSYIVRRREERP